MRPNSLPPTLSQVKEQVAMVASLDSSGDHVLGTDEEELARLELQNQVWLTLDMRVNDPDRSPFEIKS